MLSLIEDEDNDKDEEDEEDEDKEDEDDLALDEDEDEDEEDDEDDAGEEDDDDASEASEAVGSAFDSSAFGLVPFFKTLKSSFGSILPASFKYFLKQGMNSRTGLEINMLAMVTFGPELSEDKFIQLPPTLYTIPLMLNTSFCLVGSSYMCSMKV